MKFRLVDSKITSWTPWQDISGIKTVSFEEYSLKEAFGDPPRLPELLVLESFLQFGNWLVMLSSDFHQMGMVGRISEVRFHDGLFPGERLQLEVRLMRRRENGFELAGEGSVQGRTVIYGWGCVASTSPLVEYQDAEDLRVLFSEIFDPAGYPGASPGAPASLPAWRQLTTPAGKDVH